MSKAWHDEEMAARVEDLRQQWPEPLSQTEAEVLAEGLAFLARALIAPVAEQAARPQDE